MIRNLTVFLFFFFLSNTYLFADMPHYLDFKYILNESNAGKKAQKYLKDLLISSNKKFNDTAKKLKDEENKIIGQKNVLTKEDYRKKADTLRKKVFELN